MRTWEMAAAPAQVRIRQGTRAVAGDPGARRSDACGRSGTGRRARRWAEAPGGARRRASTSTRCASARFRSRTRSRVRRGPTTTVRRRAESRRAIADALVNECGIDPQKLIPILHYDGNPLTDASSRARSPRRRAFSHVTPLRKAGDDLRTTKMTYLTKPKLHPGLPTKLAGAHAPRYEGACRRCAPAAATIPFRRQSCRRSSSSRSRRIVWRSCPESAARRRRRRTSWGQGTASTACTGACRRW